MIVLLNRILLTVMKSLLFVFILNNISCSVNLPELNKIADTKLRTRNFLDETMPKNLKKYIPQSDTIHLYLKSEIENININYFITLINKNHKDIKTKYISKKSEKLEKLFLENMKCQIDKTVLFIYIKKEELDFKKIKHYIGSVSIYDNKANTIVYASENRIEKTKKESKLFKYIAGFFAIIFTLYILSGDSSLPLR